MKDWGELSESFDEIYQKGLNIELENESEAQTRFDIIDRIIKEILQWEHGQISVEPHTTGKRNGFIDYILVSGDTRIIIEAKKIGASFPTPTKRKKLKLTGTILGSGEIKEALNQAEAYARNLSAEIVMVTNGKCWCFYPLNFDKRDSVHATLLFPFDNPDDGELLFNLFCAYNVENESLKSIGIDTDIILNNRLNLVVDNGDYRVGRNSIADHIMVAVDNAIMAEGLLKDQEVLRNCYVFSDSRVKFDSTLQMHLSQYKPALVEPAKKIKRGRKNDALSNQLKLNYSNANSPVTLIIGSVGSGKTTYLKHFELVKGKDLLREQKAHWIYIDLEKLGKDGNPRRFIYSALNDYLLKDNPHNPTDFETVIRPAYEEEISALARGPYALLAKNAEKWEEKIIELIDRDYQDVEPYVEKVYRYISAQNLCVIVIDNVDLYEDDNLETTVFSETISISKKIGCSTIVSIRDTTFVKHKNTSIFNAYELKKFWINPPSFKEVLSKRLTYSKHLLKDTKASIETYSGKRINVPDLSLFFSIVQKSVLNEKNGRHFEYLSDRNPRKGILLIKNFLSSGHIQADRAINNYLVGEADFIFPFHEIFKGSMLGQWKYYKESRSEAFNLFESGIGPKSLQLIRLYTIRLLHDRAKIGSQEVLLSEIATTISPLGISIDGIKDVMESLRANSLVHSNNEHSDSRSYHITLCGGYYWRHLSRTIVYAETILYDTNILDQKLFEELSEITLEIENCRDFIARMKIRKTRMELFTKYLSQIEEQALNTPELSKFNCIEEIAKAILSEFEETITKLEYKRARFGI